MDPTDSGYQSAKCELPQDDKKSSDGSRREHTPTPRGSQGGSVVRRIGSGGRRAAHAETSGTKTASSLAVSTRTTPAPESRTPSRTTRGVRKIKAAAPPQDKQVPSAITSTSLKTAESTMVSPLSKGVSLRATTANVVNAKQADSVSTTGHPASSRTDAGGVTSANITRKLTTRSRVVCGASLAVIAVSLLTMALLSLLWPRVTPPRNACTTHACFAYSARLRASINSSVNPCASFTRFVCDGWQRNSHQLSVWEDQFHYVLDRLTQTLRHIDVPKTGQNEEQRAAAVYRSCDALLRGTSDQLAVVKAALADAGIVWPAVSKGADVLHTLLYSAVILGLDVIFYFNTIPLRGALEVVLHPGKSFVFVLTKHRRLKETRTKKHYFDILKASFDSDGANAVSYGQISDFDEPALNIMDVITETTSDSAISAAVGYKNTPEIGLTEEHWVAALRRINVNVSRGVHLSTVRPEYLEAVLSIWKKLGSDTFHLHVSWWIVQVAALFSNRHLVLNFYEHDLERAHIYHGAFCITRAIFFSRRALFAKYNSDVTHGGSEVAARKVALAVRQAFFDRVSKWPYYDSNVTVVGDWNSVETVFYNIRQDKENQTSTDTPGLDMSDSLLKNWKLSASIRNPPEVDEMLTSIYQLRYYIQSYRRHDLELMPYALSFPLFDDTMPASLNYGGFGAQLASALGDIFLFSYDDTNKAPQVQALLGCMRSGPYGDVSDHWIYTSRAIGYAALVDAFKKRGLVATDQSVYGLENYSSEQLLFIALCYVACEGMKGVDGESVCNMPLQYLPEFAEAFNCVDGDKMKQSPTRCELP